MAAWRHPQASLIPHSLDWQKTNKQKSTDLPESLQSVLAKDIHKPTWLLMTRANWKHSAPGGYGSLWWAHLWWRNRRKRKAEWFMCYGQRQNWRSGGDEEQADVGSHLSTSISGSRLLPRAVRGCMVLPQPGTVLASVIGVSPKPTWMAVVWAITCAHVCAWGL